MTEVTLVSEWRYELTPLTPIHIAAGDTIEPFEYMIHEGRLYKFDPEAFLLALAPAEQNRFVDLAGTNLIEARKFLSARGDLVKQIAEYNLPASDSAQTYYERNLSNSKSDLSIGVFIRTNRRAYIPGSSLKGALRTALLYQHAGKPTTEWRADMLEAETFGYARQQRDGRKRPSVTDDPFKYFKISDSDVREEMTQLAVVNVHTKGKEGWLPGKIPLLREVTWGALTNHSKAHAATTTFSVIVNEIVARAARQADRAKWFSREQIIAACRAFYGEHLKQEAQFHRDNAAARAFYDALQKWAEQLPNDACLIRLGWGSGFDAVTVRYARDGKQPIDQVRPSRDDLIGQVEAEFKKNGKDIKDRRVQGEIKREVNDRLLLYTPASRRLVEGGAPLGWAELRIVPANVPSDISAFEERLKQVNEIVVTEASPTPQAAPAEESKPAATEDVDALVAQWKKKLAKDTPKESPPPTKKDAGAEERRKQEEIIRRMRKGQ